jgi:hypothetical protein
MPGPAHLLDVIEQPDPDQLVVERHGAARVPHLDPGARPGCLAMSMPPCVTRQEAAAGLDFLEFTRD